jgi:hypothetical protein
MDKYSETLTRFFNDAKRYFEVRYDLARLDFIDKLAFFTSFFIKFLIFVLLFTSFFLFISFALAYYLGNLWRTYYGGFLAVAGIYLIFAIIIIIFRKQLISNPVLKMMLKKMFNQKSKQG